MWSLIGTDDMLQIGCGTAVDSTNSAGSSRTFNLTTKPAPQPRLRTRVTFAILACMADVTQILSQIEQGDPAAAEQLLPLVYEELRKLAAAKMAQEKPGQTFQATALVHEAYLNLVDVDRAQKWDSRGHFFAAAAEAMRRILIDRARSKAAVKHGGELSKVDFDSAKLANTASPGALLAIDEALDRLKVEQPLAAKLVNLRYFAGLSIDDAAIALGISSRSAYRHWTYARAWLFKELLGDDET